MAETTSDISYPQMVNFDNGDYTRMPWTWPSQYWFNFHNKQALSSYWGDCITSSSDKVRVQIGVKALNADAYPHYRTGKGAKIFKFVSDQFSIFLIVKS